MRALTVLDLLIDVLKSSIAIWVAGALKSFLVERNADAQLPQQTTYQGLTSRIAMLSERPGEMLLALAYPQKRRFGITADR